MIHQKKLAQSLKNLIKKPTSKKNFSLRKWISSLFTKAPISINLADLLDTSFKNLNTLEQTVEYFFNELTKHKETDGIVKLSYLEYRHNLKQYSESLKTELKEWSMEIKNENLILHKPEANSWYHNFEDAINNSSSIYLNCIFFILLNLKENKGHEKLKNILLNKFQNISKILPSEAIELLKNKFGKKIQFAKPGLNWENLPEQLKTQIKHQRIHNEFIQNPNKIDYQYFIKEFNIPEDGLKNYNAFNSSFNIKSTLDKKYASIIQHQLILYKIKFHTAEDLKISDKLHNILKKNPEKVIDANKAFDAFFEEKAKKYSDIQKLITNRNNAINLLQKAKPEFYHEILSLFGNKHSTEQVAKRRYIAECQRIIKNATNDSIKKLEENSIALQRKPTSSQTANTPNKVNNIPKVGFKKGLLAWLFNGLRFEKKYTQAKDTTPSEAPISSPVNNY